MRGADGRRDQPVSSLLLNLPTSRFGAARNAVWNRSRFLLGIGLVLAVVLPFAVRYQFSPEGSRDSLEYSLIGTALAVVMGYYAFRKLGQYPGTRASYYILPSFTATFGIVLAVFFFLRIDYSRLHFLASYSISAFWFFAAHFTLQRRRVLTLGVLPFGAVDNLRRIGHVRWVVLDELARPAPAIDAIVADLRADIPDEWERYLTDRALDGVMVMHVKQIEESLTGRVAIEHLSENNFGSLIPGILYAKVKRLTDFLSVLVLAPLLLPLLAVVALLIRFDSRGPIIFRQQRMGYRGETFSMYKFRTMRVAEDSDGDARSAAITRNDDDRITRIGRVLRQYRIDELPQIVNILRGEMSWIGPRPEAVPLSLWYEAELPFYRYRHIVRPGITGWAQVKQGHVAEVDEVLWKLHYDFFYIKNFGIWLDVLIVAATIRTVLSGFGAR